MAEDKTEIGTENEVSADELAEEYLSVSSLSPDYSEYGIFGFLADSPIFGIEAVPPKPARRRSDAEVVHIVPAEIVPRSTSRMYDLIYLFGIGIIRSVKRFFKFIISLFYKPIHAAKVFAGITFVLFDKFAMRSFHNAMEDYSNLRKEVRQSIYNFIHTFEGTPAQVVKRLIHYPKNAYKDHSAFFKSAANLMMPLAALTVLILTVTHILGSTYALEVIIEKDGEDTSIGYISNESVYIDARNIVKDRIDSGAGDESSALANPTYKIAKVKLNQLSDADTIGDKLIENSDSGLTAACGIYIDGDFICAVKNEADARRVFDNILAEAEKKYKIDDNDANSFADFVEDVEFVQGLYSDTEEKMWDASKLDKNLREGTRSEAIKYIIRDGDYPAKIADRYDISVKDLMSYNPDVDFEVFPTGTPLTVKEDVKYVRVQIIKYVEKKEDINYTTETVYSDSLYSGDRKVVRKGKKGVDSVTYMRVYIDGVFTKEVEASRTTLVEPINAKIQVGTKKVSNSVAGISGYSVTVNGRFVWPVSGLYTITSGYGYRSSGFHTGIDISGANASGKLVLAAESGTVEMIKFAYTSYGNQILINHGNGVKTRYAHLLDNSISVTPGQYVSRGQAIARVGSTGNSTGPHLHFEVIINGSTVNPLGYIS